VTALRDRLSHARLYLVCGEASDEFLRAALRGGVDIVQLRMKASSDAEIVTVARRFARACAAHDVLFILNDRPDLVAAAGADGVHVGQDDTPTAQARTIVGPERLVGLSTHSPAQIDAAARGDGGDGSGSGSGSGSGVDYIGVGPVHETPTKPGRPAVGLELVRYAAGHAAVPFFAIGGIDPGNLAGVRAAGARRVAIVRALTEAADPERAARELRTQLESDPSPEGVPVGAT
jgi:thiamine-phosphate pyrophosphorylase